LVAINHMSRKVLAICSGMAPSIPSVCVLLSILFGTSTAFVTSSLPSGTGGTIARWSVGIARPAGEYQGAAPPTLLSAHAVGAIGVFASAALLAGAVRPVRMSKARSVRTVDRRCVALRATDKRIGQPGTQALLVNEDGITAPFGEPGKYYWDPLNLAEEITPERYAKYRSAEIKHGRVAMLAVLGTLVQQKVRFPLADFQDADTGLQALDLNSEAVRFGLLLIFIFAGYLETNSSDEGRAPGDLGDPANWEVWYNSWDDKWTLETGDARPNRTLLRNYETNHGRAAMVGIIAAWYAESESGLSKVTDQWAATPSSVLMFFKGLGVLPSYYY